MWSAHHCRSIQSAVAWFGTFRSSTRSSSVTAEIFPRHRDLASCTEAFAQQADPVLQEWGKPEACYRSLLAAERAAPAEVRYRPPVRRMTADLLRADRRETLPGLRAFATRVGVRA